MTSTSQQPDPPSVPVGRERRIAPDAVYFFTISLLFLALAGQFVIALAL